MFRSPKAHLSTTEKLKGENKRPETSDDEQAMSTSGPKTECGREILQMENFR